MKTTRKAQEEFIAGYDKWSDDLFRYAYFKVSNRDLALDLVQDTFTKSWEYITSGNKVKKLRPFLYKTLRNLIIDHYRKKKSESLDNLIEEGFDFGYDETDMIENKLLGENIWDKIKDLDDKYQEVLMLRYADDLSITEISALIKESENNVSVRIHRGLTKLKEISNL